MSDLGITPAPWAYKYGEVIGNEGREVVCEPFEDADAHLIAAAPELYAALEKCIDALEFIVGDDSTDLENAAWNAANAAVAKAQGTHTGEKGRMEATDE